MGYRALVSDERAVLIHVGLPKTGTTSFQLRCVAIEEQLLEHGILYPTAGRHFDQHRLLCWELEQRPDRPVARNSLASLVRELDELQPPRVLLSSEMLCTLGHRPDRLALLRDRLRDAGYRPTVLLVLRDRTDYLNALYGELLYRHLLSMTREQFFAEADELGSVTVAGTVYPTDLELLVRRFEEVFGSDAVVVLDYQPSQMSRHLAESQAWFFGTTAALFDEEITANRSADRIRILEDRLGEVYASRSWKLAAPIRKATPALAEWRARLFRRG